MEPRNEFIHITMNLDATVFLNGDRKQKTTVELVQYNILVCTKENKFCLDSSGMTSRINLESAKSCVDKFDWPVFVWGKCQVYTLQA